jgi:Protein of unknown function (DUF1236)
MKNRFLISAAAIALIASAGFAHAQGTGMNRESGGGGAAAQQGAPSGGNSAAPSNRNASEPSGMKSTQSEQKSPNATKGQTTGQSEQGQKSKGVSSENEPKGGKDMKAEDRESQKSTGSERNKSSTVGQSQRGEENAPGQKQKGMSSETETKGGKDMKTEGREGRDRDQNNAQIREGRDRDQNAQTRDGTQTTTGQAGGGKLSTEQRTKITSVIRNQRVQSVNNVDFNISVGTRVPRERVHLSPLPEEVVSIYPEWRGYEFIRVRDKIIVVDPRTQEIVDVLDV